MVSEPAITEEPADTRLGSAGSPSGASSTEPWPGSPEAPIPSGRIAKVVAALADWTQTTTTARDAETLWDGIVSTFDAHRRLCTVVTEELGAEVGDRLRQSALVEVGSRVVLDLAVHPEGFIRAATLL